MKHMRSDYDRIQDPANLIPENEPVLLIRAQDVFSEAVANKYYQLCSSVQISSSLEGLLKHIDLIRNWPFKKIPTVPGVENININNKSNMQNIGNRFIPVAIISDVEFSRYTIEYLNGPIPKGTVLYSLASDVAASL